MKKAHGNFQEYLRYFMLLSFTLVILQGCLQTAYSSRLMRQEVLHNSQNTLNMLRSSHEIMLSQVEESVENVFSSTMFSDFIDYYQKQQYYEVNTIAEQLNTMVKNNDAIRSVCIYYREEAYTLSSDLGPAPLEYYHSADFLRELDASDFRFRRTVRREVLYTFQTKKETVFTMVRTLPVYYTSERPDAYVLIDLNQSYIESVIRAMDLGEDACIWVIDDEGNVLSRVGNQAFHLSECVDVTQELRDGSEILQINGRSTLVTRAAFDEQGWAYVYAVPLDTITGRVTLLLYGCIEFCILAMLAGYAGSYVFSQRIYRPISRLAEILPKEVGSNIPGKETERIARYIDEMLDKNRRLEQSVSEWQTNGWRGILIDNMLHSHETANEGNLQRLDLYERKSAVYILCLTDAALPESPQIRASLIQQGAYDSPLYLLPFDSEKAVAVVCLPREADMSEKIGHILSEAGNGCSVGISARFASGHSLHIAYLQAMQALDMRFICGQGSIMLFENQGCYLSPRYPIALENRILLAVKRASAKEMETALLDFAGYYRRESSAAATARSGYLQLYCSIWRLINTLGYTDSECAFDHERFLALPTLEAMNEELGHMCRGIWARIENHSTGRNGQLIAQICSYIDANVGANLSYEQIGEKFSISPSHLRQVFRDERGVTMKDYVDQKRLERAKQLLQSDALVRVIAEQLGFLSPQAFAKFFKGFTGLSPGEYREKERSDKP